YDNGKLTEEGNYFNGVPGGVWKQYHENGQLKSQMSFIEGAQEGEYTEYYDNGVLNYKSNYKKGEIYGNVEYFAPDGKRYALLVFENNNLKSAKYFDKSGKEISSSERKGKTLDLTSYDMDGYKLSVSKFN